MRPWRCHIDRSLLVDYADGALEPRRRLRVARHLTACRDCARTVGALRDVAAQLRAAAVPEPEDAFWSQQRRHISRVVRHLPEPRPSWLRQWLQAGSVVAPWRYPIAVALCALAVLFVYRVAARFPATQPGTAAPGIAALDRDALATADELLQALVPSDEQWSAAASDEEVVLALAQPSDSVAGDAVRTVPGLMDLTASELDQLEELIGDVG